MAIKAAIRRRARPLAPQAYDRIRARLARRSRLAARFERANGNRVLAGPFEGVSFPPRSARHLRTPVPFLAGTYERELHPAIERLIERRPDTIVNLGAAEGLYAAGLARRCRGARVIGFEAEEHTARRCAQVARLNDVAVDVRGTATVAGLRDLDVAGHTLVVSDCDGPDYELLDLDRVPWLAAADVLVELHPPPSAAEALREHLSATHEVERIEIEPRGLSDYPESADLTGFTDEEALVLLDEGRMDELGWLVAYARGERDAIRS